MAFWPVIEFSALYLHLQAGRQERVTVADGCVSASLFLSKACVSGVNICGGALGKPDGRHCG